jgi:hypothetical protein
MRVYFGSKAGVPIRIAARRRLRQAVRGNRLGLPRRTPYLLRSAVSLFRSDSFRTRTMCSEFRMWK